MRLNESVEKLPDHQSRWTALRPVAVSVLLAAIVFALATNLYPRPPIIHDAYGYTMTAQRLAYHGDLSWGTEPPGERRSPNAFVTPGYPLFLAALYVIAGDRSTEGTVTAQAVQPVVQGAQFLVALGIVALIAGCGVLLGGGRLGYVAGVLAALYLPFSWGAAVALSETLGAFLAALQLLIALRMTGASAPRPWWLFAAFGTVSATLGLVRPALVLWTAVPIIYLFARRLESPRRLLLLTGAALVGFSLVMVPWWVRNAVVLDRFVPLSTGAGNPMLLASGGEALSPAEQEVADRAHAEGRDPFVAAARYRMTEQFKADPVAFVAVRARVIGRVVGGVWIAPLDVMWEENYHYDATRVDLGGPFPKWPSLPLARSWSFARFYQWFLLVAAAASLLFIRKSPRLILVATFPLYVVGVHFLTLFLNRYFFPAMPSVIVLAAAGLYGVWHAVTTRVRTTQA